MSAPPKKKKPHPPRSGPRRRPAGGAARGRQPFGEAPILYGIHTVAEALGNPARRVHRLLATANALHRLSAMLPDRDWPEPVSVRDIDRLAGADAVHQGAALICEPLPEPDLADVAALPLLIALDQVTDPHNVGAVLRSAAAFGAGAIVMTARHSPPETGVLAKAASGALEHVALVRVRNLAKALEELRQAGHFLLGLDGEAQDRLGEDGLPERLVLVLGAEGKGLREKTKAACDRLVRLPTHPPIASLNVSNAAAIALYEASRRGTASSA
ncbi:23S rRNA (guanosine(2251)-2'-O)-methyltransferase RlmB [Afifella pfennigii]|uniref:23S rRNA (guanosine(2251)-2'-O)-methyltransferase RlmB n=1 Tax=Afifella pfennigii TaxID=209897 RepID=UPI0005551DE9|nr:23S rRNA (guanosine(2251)-2'-O)-methyltransferase RlmB [Afifella pfennigii]